MWRDYFGPGCQIIGIDINPKSKQHEADSIEVFIGSQDDPAVIDAIFAKYPKVDIVLDDGSHMMKHMIDSFKLMYHRLQPNGVYIVEDTHTCYWNNYGGGVKRAGSFMEFAKDKLDEINAVHTQGVLPVTDFTRSTNYIAFYDSVVVFERRKQGKRQHPITGSM